MSSDAVESALFWLASELDENPGVLFRSGDDDVNAADPKLTAAEVAARIGAIDLRSVDRSLLRASMRASLDSARYWQEPDGTDVAAATPEIRAALLLIAELITSSLPLLAAPRGKKQWTVDWNPAVNAAPLALEPAAELRRWTRELAEDVERSTRDHEANPHARQSGTWWSVPLTLLETRGSVEYALELVEDSFGWTAATFIPVSGDGSVSEIRSAADWAQLCRDYPVEVTAARRHDWYRTTGRDGRWAIPDWERVAEDWDAVHLTALGYFSAATQLIEVDGTFASVIAGWAPDSTLWLNDVAREAAAARQEWARPTEQDEWVRCGAA